MTYDNIKRSEAQNLLWRWNCNCAGKDAFSAVFGYGNPLSEAATFALRGKDGTYTGRLEGIATGRVPTIDLSPASLAMRQYSASGYTMQDLPDVTRDAMLKWLNERSRILFEFCRFFSDDERHHPYQICIGDAQTRVDVLRRTLEQAFQKSKA
jgi:hypothetical protein